ncbi:MAG TPA: substrate-binding domain-containing protein [Candidatus Limnocylindrales bacterium]|nr:substrate-binding domain-containing protein [Candidatus Limnocylindrales bacterium]
MKTSNHGRYMVKSLVHASRILESFQSAGDVLRLRDVVARTGFNKGMCFRLLYTLHQCGFLDKVGENHYRLASEVRRRRLYRIGYAAQGQDSSFDREVRLSLQRAAEREHIELITVDNRYQPKIALRNADYLIREQVDLVIEFQTDEVIAPAIASKYMEGNVPLIAIDIPHPGATYFGANNYQAGLMAGHTLARWAKKHWGGEPEEILLIELMRAGSLPKARLRGVLTGISEAIRVPERCRTVSLDGDGQFQTTLERVRKHLRESKARHVLVGTANDSSALGALRAFQEAGRAQDCAIVGQNGEPEARAELRTANTRLIGSVAYFPEKYGDGLLRLALDILARRVVPPAVFTNHQILTPENVDHFYPNDSLLSIPA